jgi:hypothetical protein
MQQLLLAILPPVGQNFVVVWEERQSYADAKVA